MVSSCECGHCVGMNKAWDSLEKKLCPEGKAAAKRKFKATPLRTPMDGQCNTAEVSLEGKGRRNEQMHMSRYISR